jgi:hypothetical protein
MTLVNPFKAQRPRITLRVLWGFDAEGTSSPSAAGSGSDVRSSDANFEYGKLAGSARSGASAAGNISLQPRAPEIRNRRDIQVDGSADAVTLSASNPLDKVVYEENALPEWSRRLDMSRHRGLGLWVTGDASQAILVVQIPGGDYVIPVDFTGRHYIEIPNSQVAWADGRWGWRMGSKHAHYEAVNWVKMGFGMLPANSKASVTVAGLTALRELDTELKDPAFQFGNDSLTIRGAIPSGSYLTWDGGETATIYDANWNRTGGVPVIGTSVNVPEGQFEFKLSSSYTNAALPWVDLQLITQGTPISVPDDGKPAARK